MKYQLIGLLSPSRPVYKWRRASDVLQFGDFLVSDDIDNSVKNTFNKLKSPVNQFAMWRAFTRQQLHTLRLCLSELKWKHIEVKLVHGHPSDWIKG